MEQEILAENMLSTKNITRYCTLLPSAFALILLSLLTNCNNTPTLKKADDRVETSLYYALRRIEGTAPFEGISEERWVQYLDEGSPLASQLVSLF